MNITQEKLEKILKGVIIFCVGWIAGVLITCYQIPNFIKEYNDFSNKQVVVKVNPPSYLEDTPLYNNPNNTIKTE